MRILKLLVVITSFGLLLFPSEVCAQQSSPPKIVGVRVGLADRYKAGLWTQVEVTLRGGSDAIAGELAVIVPDGDEIGRAHV